MTTSQTAPQEPPTADRTIVNSALNNIDWRFVGPGSHATCSARSAAEQVALTAATRAREDERNRLAGLIQANEATLNSFAKDGSVAGLIAYLVGTIAAPAVDGATRAQEQVTTRISCIDAARALRDLADDKVYTEATTIRAVSSEDLEISGPRDEVVMVLVDLNFIRQVSREAMLAARAIVKAGNSTRPQEGGVEFSDGAG